MLQNVWYEQQLAADGLRTLEGHRLRVLSPGWWNHQEGPDFKGAQIDFNGRTFAGDVEVHFRSSAWRQHGHHLDPRYEGVILHVILDEEAAPAPAATLGGRSVPTLALRPWLAKDLLALSSDYETELQTAPCGTGSCAALVPEYGTHALEHFLDLAGEWRLLNKSRQMRERMDQAGEEQALYEYLMYACGFSHFKHHFQAVARALPYERARQLSRQDPLLLEATLFQVAGLLPEVLPPGTSAVPHFARLRALRHEKLPGLKSLPIEWRRVGIRPNNYPERRLGGMAQFIARTASKGLAATLREIWQPECTAIERRRQIEKLFPTALGFWATHCTWTGKRLARPTLPLGETRARAIIGNVFIPAGLAVARRERDPALEERVFEFFCALPAESGNHITKLMLPRVLGPEKKIRLNFRRQQGLLQMYQDWCEPNPSCRNCGLLRYLEREALLQK
ncbi:MAG: DUF2851 family protein [Candidatus Hydrogenedentes bacterium]|nr:DUF2851 family protein [Candidatus Hydrogenedentota bacterium]